MTSPAKQDPSLPPESPGGFSLERVSRLVDTLEQELARAPDDLPNARALKEEVETLKHVLAAPGDREEGWITERLHGIRDTLHDTTARVEGEVLKDSPVVAELGRILGMV